jgi:hypothetical protein
MREIQRLRQRVGKFQPTEMGHFRPALTWERQLWAGTPGPL